MVPARAIVPDDAAGFLQRPVPGQQFRAHDPRVRPPLEHRARLVQPARPDLGVVVEKEQEFTPRGPRGGVAGADEAEIGFIPQQPDAAHPRQGAYLAAREGIVHDDDLDGRLRKMRRDRGETVQSVGDLAVCRNDHRDRGRLRQGQDDVLGREVGPGTGTGLARRRRITRPPQPQTKPHRDVPPQRQDRAARPKPQGGGKFVDETGEKQAVDECRVGHCPEGKGKDFARDTDHDGEPLVFPQRSRCRGDW